MFKQNGEEYSNVITIFQILIVGAAVSLVAQFLSLTTAVRRLRSNPNDAATFIFINTELSLFTSNLIFMLGVQVCICILSLKKCASPVCTYIAMLSFHELKNVITQK
jgi:hypothetical protein